MQIVAKPVEGCRFHTKMVRYGYFKQNAVNISILECIRDLCSAANFIVAVICRHRNILPVPSPS